MLEQLGEKQATRHMCKTQGVNVLLMADMDVVGDTEQSYICTSQVYKIRKIPEKKRIDLLIDVGWLTRGFAQRYKVHGKFLSTEVEKRTSPPTNCLFLFFSKSGLFDVQTFGEFHFSRGLDGVQPFIH